MTSFTSRAGRLLFPALLIVAWETAAQSTSVIAVPIRTSLTPIAAEIEQRVEKRFSDTTRERGIDIRYEVERAPLKLAMIGAGLHSTTTMKYALEACRGRFPCVSCGFGEPRRIADIRLQTKLDWDPSWRLRSTTRLLPVHYAPRCEVTWLGIDITRRFVAPVVEDQLHPAARIIDRQTPALTNIRPRAEQIWTSLQQPVELAPRTWLVLDPTSVALTPISGSGPVITSTLMLHATTRVVLGDRPAATNKPLPPLRVANAVPDVVRVPFDLELPYAEASRIATRDYANKTHSVDGRPLKIESIQVLPAGSSGRVLLVATIDYRGGALRNYRGVVFLEGTPRFDPATSSIVVPDLDYSLDTNRQGLFARIAERAAHDSIRQRMRESARFELRSRITEVREEVTRALNRTLADGVLLRGRADAIEPVSVTPMPEVISVRVIATGRAEVELRSLTVR